jgi:hypothetical protein
MVLKLLRTPCEKSHTVEDAKKNQMSLKMLSRQPDLNTGHKTFGPVEKVQFLLADSSAKRVEFDDSVLSDWCFSTGPFVCRSIRQKENCPKRRSEKTDDFSARCGRAVKYMSF